MPTFGQIRALELRRYRGNLGGLNNESKCPRRAPISRENNTADENEAFADKWQGGAGSLRNAAVLGHRLHSSLVVVDHEPLKLNVRERSNLQAIKSASPAKIKTLADIIGTGAV